MIRHIRQPALAALPATLVATLVATGSLFAQDPPTTDANAAMRAMMERSREATTPGPQHEALRYYLGEWDVVLAMVMPGTTPQRSNGRATFEWLIDGRWLSQRIRGELMGLPYESFSIHGFDNYAKNHVMTTVNNFDTALNDVRGVIVDPQGRTTALYGTLDEYATGELAKPYKVVTRMLDTNRFVVETWDLGIGPDGAKVLEFSYTRRR